MALEHLKAEVSLLVGNLADHPQDTHELYQQLHQKLNALRAMAQPVPADLERLEKALEDEFETDSGLGLKEEPAMQAIRRR
jgi:hypothetical protein